MDYLTGIELIPYKNSILQKGCNFDLHNFKKTTHYKMLFRDKITQISCDFDEYLKRVILRLIKGFL